MPRHEGVHHTPIYEVGANVQNRAVLRAMLARGDFAQAEQIARPWAQRPDAPLALQQVWGEANQNVRSTRFRGQVHSQGITDGKTAQVTSCRSSNFTIKRGSLCEG